LPRPKLRHVENAAKPVPQVPGCLPEGFTTDSLLTVEQFAIWRQQKVDTFRRKIAAGAVKGVSGHGSGARVHVGTYLHFHVSNYAKAQAK